MHPLHALLSSTTKTEQLPWTDDTIAAFNATKDALANATYPKLDAPTCLVTDASDTAVGAVLQQHINGAWHPISFFSKKMKPAETRYSTFDRELLAIYLAIKGHYFHILTDHKPLTHALNTRSDRHSPRQARQLDYISQFTSVIRHVHGVDNVVADALSRVETNALLSGTPPVLDFDAMAMAQQEDRQIHALQSSPSSSLQIQPMPLLPSGSSILCDTSTGTPRPLVPLSWRRTIFDSLHSLSHPGIRATRRLLTSQYAWPGINADVRKWARSCIQCHRWPEAVPLTDITAEDVAKAFIQGWVSRFGTPSTVVTDRGRQFQSNLWTALTTLLGSKRARTTSYHPLANGLVERFHRQLKAALKTRPQSTWVESLPLVLLGIRTALKEDLHCTAAELVYGTNLRLPGEFFTSPSSTPTLERSDYVLQLKSRMSQIRPISPRLPQRHNFVNPDLSTCTHVFIRHDAVRKPLQPPYIQWSNVLTSISQ